MSRCQMPIWRALQSFCAVSLVLFASGVGFGCSKDLENKKLGVSTSPQSGKQSTEKAKAKDEASTDNVGDKVTANRPSSASVIPTSIAEVKLPAAPATAQQCVTCHQTSSYRPFSTGTPYLVGQSKEYILFQLKQYLFDRRSDLSSKMKDIAYGLVGKVLEANEIAEYFSKLKLQVSKDETISYRDMNLAKRGEKIARDKCTSCHMNAEFDNGPTDALVPRLAGQSKQYLLRQLLEYRNEEEVKPRRNKLMSSLANKLSDDDMEAIAAFFASQK